MTPPPDRKQLLLGGGHLAAVWSLAFVQPLLDLLGKNPDFFIARGNTPGDILIFTFGLILIPPLILFTIEMLVVRFSVPGYRRLHPVLLGGMSIFFFTGLISPALGGHTLLILVVAVGLGALFAWGCHRSRFIRNALDLLIVAPLVILGMFIFASQTSKVIFPGPDEARLALDSGDDHPVVMVIFDELGTFNLMTDRNSIDAGRYPNFARLSSQSTWFINHSTTSFSTPKAIPGILTGRLPPDDALATAADQPENIFTLLGRDRPFHVMEPVTALCPDTLCPDEDGERSRLGSLLALASDLRYVEGHLVLPPGLASRLPDVGGTFEHFGDDRSGVPNWFFVKGLDLDPAPREFRAFLKGIPDSRRGLTVMHLLLPHQPWRDTADGRRYNVPPGTDPWDSNADRWLTGESGIVTSQARMYTQTGFADALVGELEKTVRAKGLWDDAIVVVTADHGGSFLGGEVTRRRVDRKAMGEVANPPLFIKYPGQRKGRIDRRHSLTLDILPTIADAVKAGGQQRFDGVPLQGPVPDRPVTVKRIGNEDQAVSVDPAVMVRQRNTAITQANRRLGTGPIYTLGPRPDLIGQAVPPIPAGTANAVLDTPELWNDVHPDRQPVPVNVTGRTESLGPGTTVAIAVNRRIQGTAGIFRFEDANRFGTLVNPSALKRGRNEIGIYTVKGETLIPVGGNPE